MSTFGGSTGFSFGTNATSTASKLPAFGSFGSTPAAGNTFGNTGTASTFGAPKTTSAFGTPGATTTFGAPRSAFGSTGFGTTSTPSLGAPTSTGFSFGTATTTASGTFGTGTTFGTSTAGTFGTGSSGLFGSTGNTFGGGTSFGGFGTSNAGFGNTTTTSFGLNSQQQQQQQFIGSQDKTEQLYASVLQCSVFRDDRDSLLARWNLIQASWGSGNAFYLNNAPPVQITNDNPLCKFKAIGYTALPSWTNQDGLIRATVKKPHTEMNNMKNQFETSIQGIFGNKPNVKVNVHDVNSISLNSSEVTFYVTENGRKLPVSDIFPFFSQTTVAQSIKNLGLEDLAQKLAFSEQQVTEYLETPPQGVDPRLWKQAQLDNPDPKKLIPVPMIGFKSLQQRITCQEQQASSYKGRLDIIASDISDLQKKHQNTLAGLAEFKRKQLELSHRLLHIIVRQEATRKLGFTIQPEEEKLRVQLEALYAELSAPTQYKGRLNELLSQIRLQSQTPQFHQTTEKYEMDPYMKQDINNILKQQEDGIQALIETIQEDNKDLQLISDGLNKGGDGVMA